MEVTNEFRDTTKASRKGRKPKNDKAMTPAERKRQQRSRQKEAKADLPSWLRLRRDLWKVIQDQFIFADVDELANTLHALGAALSLLNAYRSDPGVYDWKAGLALYMDPDNFPKDRDYLSGLFPELKAYQFDGSVYPDRQGTKLFGILRDIIEGSRNSKDQPQT